MDKKCWPDAAPKAVKSFPPKLPKRERIVIKTERAQIISRGRVVPYSHFLVWIVPDQEWGLSLVVRKNVKPASRRNYLKRIVREAYRTAKPACSAPKKIAVTIQNSDSKFSLATLQRLFIEG